MGIYGKYGKYISEFETPFSVCIENYDKYMNEEDVMNFFEGLRPIKVDIDSDINILYVEFEDRVGLSHTLAMDGESHRINELVAKGRRKLKVTAIM